LFHCLPLLQSPLLLHLTLLLQSPLLLQLTLLLQSPPMPLQLTLQGLLVL
jgi:hypothetical protein